MTLSHGDPCPKCKVPLQGLATRCWSGPYGNGCGWSLGKENAENFDSAEGVKGSLDTTSTAHPGEAVECDCDTSPCRAGCVEGHTNDVPNHAESVEREAGGDVDRRKEPGGSPEVATAPRTSVSLTLPWSVLASSNLRRTGKGHSHSPEYRKARENAAALVSFAYSGPPISVPVKVATVFYPPDRRRRDCHNFTKQINDALEHGGLLTDDHLIQAWEGTVEDVSKDDARVEVTIGVLGMGPETEEAA